MLPSGTLRRVALVRTDVSEESIASIVRAEGIQVRGRALAVSQYIVVGAVFGDMRAS
jgi:hypothetical protein